MTSETGPELPNREEPERRYIGEPVITPWGDSLTIELIGDTTVLFSQGGMTAHYTNEELLQLGDGNVEAGVLRVGKHLYSNPIGFGIRPMEDQLGYQS